MVGKSIPLSFSSLSLTPLWLFSQFSLQLFHLILNIFAPIMHFTSFTLSVVFFLVEQDQISSKFKYFLVFSFIESCFHFVFLYRRHAIDQVNRQIKLPCPNDKQRARILKGLLSSFESVLELRACFAGWFYQMDPQSFLPWDGRSGNVDLESILYDNAADLLAFTLYSSNLENLDSSQKVDLDKYIYEFSKALEYFFPPGRNPQVRCMKLGLEEFRVEHRPLFFYLAIGLLRLLTGTIYILVGFRRHVIHTAVEDFEYWFHPGFKSSSKALSRHHPIIIISGVCGLISMPHYAIALLWYSNRPIFLIGNDCVSLHLLQNCHKLVKIPKSTIETQVRCKILTLKERSILMKNMLRRHSFLTETKKGGGTFIIGHSLGTALTSYFAQNYDQCVIGTLLIDPISILPYLPNLARGFVYASPRTPGELAIRIISHEFGIANYIQRHFHWFEFANFTSSGSNGTRTSFDKRKTHFVLSEDDAIVCYEKVSKELKRSGVSMTTLKNTPHGGFLALHLGRMIELTLRLLQELSPIVIENEPSTRKLNQLNNLPVVHQICLNTET
ncbi:hypothetical protein PPACK8108_LOCUS10547 [Phakopsora pachyrhizi]|uniref:Uncharacterized protein n=1 Tax=Phakopsora pachyrhizi TaxID=170000 RepID=A0AAV0AYJ1_PHAPC|nr:hypothetical protein PPACK8108_LOCUS10547 [Phakopsora pachyrhizi]